MTDLSLVDPVAEVIWHLSNDPAVTAALGGPGHVSGEMEEPWPHLRVFPGSLGDLGVLRSRVNHEVSLELYGPMDNSVGSAELWRILMVCLDAACRMPDREHPPGRPVACHVNVQGGTTKQPLSNGQLRWNASLNVTLGHVEGVAPAPAP